MYYLTHTIKSNFQAIYGIFILNVVRDSRLQGFIMLGCEIKGLSVHTQRAVAQQRAGKPQNPDRETEPLPQFQPGLSWECHQLWARVDIHHGAPAHHLTDWWGLLLAGLLQSLWGAEKSIWGLCKIDGIFRNQLLKQLWVGYWGDQMGHKLATKGITRSKPPAGDTVDSGVSRDQFVCMFLSAWGDWKREDQRPATGWPQMSKISCWGISSVCASVQWVCTSPWGGAAAQGAHMSSSWGDQGSRTSCWENPYGCMFVPTFHWQTFIPVSWRGECDGAICVCLSVMFPVHIDPWLSLCLYCTCLSVCIPTGSMCSHLLPAGLWNWGLQHPHL